MRTHILIFQNNLSSKSSRTLSGSFQKFPLYCFLLVVKNAGANVWITGRKGAALRATAGRLGLTSTLRM